MPGWITTTTRQVLGVGTTFVLFAGVLVPWSQVRAATGSELFLSEYVEGSSTNKAVELYNPTDNPISLGASGFMLAFYYDGDTSIDSGVPLAGTIQPGATWVVTPTNASAPLLAKANQKFGTSWFDGNDAVVLMHSGTAVDVLGQIGVNPGAGWSTGATSTVDHTLRRKPAVNQGDANGLDPFDPAAEWDGFPVDTFDGLGNVNERLPNEPVAVSCPASVSTTSGEAASAGVSATDPDGTVVTLAVAGVTPADPGTIAVTGLTPAAGKGGTATADLTVGAATPVGTYTAALTATNNDATPQTASCDVTVTVNGPLHSLAHLRSMVDADVANHALNANKAFLLYNRLDRAAADLAADRTDAYLAQLQALGNQAAGLAPRWLTEAAADAIRSEAEALAALS